MSKYSLSAYVLRTSIDKIGENSIELTKKRRGRYPAKTITDADYADDIAILANTPNQAKPKHSSIVWNEPPQALASMSMRTKLNYMCFNQTGDISTQDGTSLKQVDKFTYLGSSVSSTEKDIGTRLTKAWTAIDKLSIIWKSDLTDKMKRGFFQASVVSILLYRCTTWTLTKRLEKTLDGNYVIFSYTYRCWIHTDAMITDTVTNDAVTRCRDEGRKIKTQEGRRRKEDALTKMQEDFFNNIFLPLTLLQGFKRVVQGLHVRGAGDRT